MNGQFGMDEGFGPHDADLGDLSADAIDLNGDGIADGVAVYDDLDGDGFLDSVTVGYDMNADGVIDTAVTSYDQDGDGVADYSLSVTQFDADGDGIVDSVYVAEDADGDTVFETEQFMDAGEWGLFSDAADADLVLPGGGTGMEVGYEQFDATETDMTQVVGTPVADESCWEFQGENGPCAIYAQCMAFEGMTGQEVDMEEIIDVATEEGWYNGKGTTMDDMDKVLNYLGADTEKDFGGTLDDIHDCLARDGRVVVAVDGNEIWDANTELYLPNDPNHAVEVIGIDYTDAEPMVIINDSGTPDGHAIQVPASQFMDAWEDSGFYYVEAYA